MGTHRRSVFFRVLVSPHPTGWCQRIWATEEVENQPQCSVGLEGPKPRVVPDNAAATINYKDFYNPPTEINAEKPVW